MPFSSPLPLSLRLPLPFSLPLPPFPWSLPLGSVPLPSTPLCFLGSFSASVPSALRFLKSFTEARSGQALASRSKQPCTSASVFGLGDARQSPRSWRYHFTFSRPVRASSQETGGFTRSPSRCASVRILVLAFRLRSTEASSLDPASRIRSVPQNCMNFSSALSRDLASSSESPRLDCNAAMQRSRCSTSSAARGCLASRSRRPSESEKLASMASDWCTQASNRARCCLERIALAGTQNGSGTWRPKTEGRLSKGGEYATSDSRTSDKKTSSSSPTSPGSSSLASSPADRSLTF
mmetsp:Transcript_62452/g.135577  ORF Transcript_62452/g.135577 Transcript_62452/m.135577 type:complete len:294 (-) Transcript_62452:1343-2224(-)